MKKKVKNKRSRKVKVGETDVAGPGPAPGPGKMVSLPVIDVSKIPEAKRKVLLCRPLKSPSKDLRWYRNKDGTITIKIKKRFTSIEKRLRKVVGGPAFLRIPLDGPGSFIWELCDGEHNVLDISHLVHEEFKEEVEPVPQRVLKFLEVLLKRNLIILERADEGPKFLDKNPKGMRNASRLMEEKMEERGSGKHSVEKGGDGARRLKRKAKKKEIIE